MEYACVRKYTYKYTEPPWIHYRHQLFIVDSGTLRKENTKVWILTRYNRVSVFIHSQLSLVPLHRGFYSFRSISAETYLKNLSLYIFDWIVYLCDMKKGKNQGTRLI